MTELVIFLWALAIIPALALTLTIDTAVYKYRYMPTSVTASLVIGMWVLAPLTYLVGLVIGVYHLRRALRGASGQVRDLVGGYREIWRHFFPKKEKPAELPKAKVVK